MEKEIISIIEKAQHGDDDAFRKLCDRYYKQAFHYALKLSKCEADAYDVVQVAFMSIYKNIYKLKNPLFFNLWMSRIVLNEVHRFYNKKKREVSCEEDMMIHLANAANQIEQEKLNDKEILHELLKTLPEKQRDMLEMVYFQQLTTKEVAEQLEIPEGTVKSRVFQAKRTLKKRIHEFEQLEGRPLSLHLDGSTPILLVFMGYVGQRIRSASIWGSACTISSVSFIIIASIATMTSYDYLRTSSTNKSPDVKETPPLSIFQRVKFKGKDVLTPKSAYFLLRNWAMDEYQIKLRTPEELLEINEVYKSLKSSNSPYIVQLQQEGWE